MAARSKLPELERLYETLRSGKAKLVGRNGHARILPRSLDAFLTRLIGVVNKEKSVHIVQNQATLTTVEAASLLGVSRQFLINILVKGEIRYHLVGTHRRIYAQDLLAYKSKRDQDRRRILKNLLKRKQQWASTVRFPLRM